MIRMRPASAERSPLEMRTSVPRQMRSRRDSVRQMLAWGAGASLGGTLVTGCAPLQPPPACEPTADDPAIGWGPSVLAPVFYGHADYAPSVGAPVNMRVYYPSLDGSPECAPFLAGPGHFPLVLFLHGQCTEDLHYTKWFRLPATLARSGFIVAIPSLAEIGAPWDLASPTYTLINSVIAWMRTSWSHSAFVMEPPTLGIVGHSWGALHGAQLALTLPATAYVSLGAGWSEWPPVPPRPLSMLTMPKLLAWGTFDIFAALSDPAWNALPSPRHRLVFLDGDHWDYVPPSATSCDSSAGPCDLVDDLAADFAAVFLSKYMPPEESGILPGLIDDNLVPPAVSLSMEQEFFVGGHLTSFGIVGSHAGCGVTLDWVTPDGTGSRTLP